MNIHPHDKGDQHRHDHAHGSDVSDMQLRVRALETVLIEKGYIDPKALDIIIDAYETKIGPHIGARVVAKAWVDPGPTIKRFQPKDRGKAYSIMKRTSHLVVTVDERE